MTSISALMSEILAAMERVDADPATKRKFRESVRQVGVVHGLSSAKREQRVGFAAELLGRRVSRPTVRDRLMALFGVSRGQAYRIIDMALNLSQRPPENET